MHDAGRVRRGHAVADLPDDVARLVDAQRADAPEIIGQRRAGDVLHRQEHHGAVVDEIVDAHDVGVRDLARRRDLAAKAIGGAGVGHAGVDDLERHALG